MKRYPTANLCALVGILGILVAPPALATDRACSPMAIEAGASRWPELPRRVHEAFDSRDDIDACARIKLTWMDGLIVVQVVLPDGRRASRSVSRREDVLPTLEGLLLVPDRSGPPPPAPVVEASPPTPSVLLKIDVSPRDSQEALKGATKGPADASGRLGIELSVAAGARIGDGQAGIGLGALSFLDVAGWLVGFEGRVDSYQRIESGPPPTGALELAALGGRRFRFGSLALDLVAGPALALRGLAETSRTQVASGSMVNTVPETRSRNDTAARLLLGTRLNFGGRSTLRTFVGVDGEFSPARSPADNLPRDEHRLPVWTIGIAFGATVGTPR